MKFKYLLTLKKIYGWNHATVEPPNCSDAFLEAVILECFKARTTGQLASSGKTGNQTQSVAATRFVVK